MRHCATRLYVRKMPIWVCVLPVSTASNMGRLGLLRSQGMGLGGATPPKKLKGSGGYSPEKLRTTLIVRCRAARTRRAGAGGVPGVGDRPVGPVHQDHPGRVGTSLLVLQDRKSVV